MQSFHDQERLYYSIAAGKISTSERILGATTQLFLHDGAGHRLHLHSGPGDDHLAATLLPFVHHFLTLAGREQVRGVVADQEMRSVALFLAGELTHRVAHAHTRLQDRKTGLSFQAEVTLVVDGRAGMPGRSILRPGTM